MPKPLVPVIRIAKYTIADEVRQRSFIVMSVICAVFIFLVRGCYHGEYMVNGRELDGGQMVIMVSKITFHVIAAGVMFLAALLSMRLFGRERNDGTQSCILSKPITRWQYVGGKVLGLWVLLTVFMFVLHGIVFAITSINLRVVMPEYLMASLLCSFNLLFIVVTVLLLSLMMPDVAAFLCIMGIGFMGSVADGIHAVSHHPMMEQIMMQQQGAQPEISFWQVVYYLWPKLAGAQHYAASLIGSEGISEPGAVYPLINIITYCLILGALLFWRFGKEDIV
ncbi:MAG TPA: ABC transporter permease subunit [Smithella sp.]|nr:ABC transporter permease subunit [Smithella sp.]